MTTQNLPIRSSNPLVGCAALASSFHTDHQSGSQMMKIQRNAQKGGILGLKWVSGGARLRGFHIGKLAFLGWKYLGKRFSVLSDICMTDLRDIWSRWGPFENCLFWTPKF